MKNEPNPLSGLLPVRLITHAASSEVCLLPLVCALVLADYAHLDAGSSESLGSSAERITIAAVLYQPLVALGGTSASESENQLLWAEIEKVRDHRAEPDLAGLEHFLGEHANSPWAASIHANLGKYDYEHGLYTRALNHWETAWNATRAETNQPAKGVADFTFANWVNLLASLGRMEDLKRLFAETSRRIFDGGPLQQQINGAKEGYHRMLTAPETCFRCGTLALKSVGQQLKGPGFDSAQIEREPSPRSGFTMTRLIELGAQAGLDLVPVNWDPSMPIPAPAIVHWKQDHYAAILKESGGDYLVADPTFGKRRWLTRAEILEESTGRFLVEKGNVPAGWRQLAKSDADSTFGRGTAYNIVDGNDGCGNGSGGGDPAGASGSAATALARGASTCSTCSSGGGGGDNNHPLQPPQPPQPPTCPCDGDGGEGGSAGMPVWAVSEPYISVWLHDLPMPAYRPGVGYPVRLDVAYNQRNSRATQSSIFGFGQMWECSWLSYITDDDPDHLSSATMAVAGGAERTYVPDYDTVEFFSYTTLERLTGTGGAFTGFVVHHANGAQDQYEFVPSDVLVGTKKVAFLTAKVDRFGHATQFSYQDTSSIVTLASVTDADGRTFSISYTNTSYPAQITSVQDPFGRVARFKYNASGRLTNIVDSIGLSSSFLYDTQGWVTNLTTPYGTTTFEHFINTDGPTNEFNNVNPYAFIRAVRIKDPAGGTNVYMLRQDSSRVYTNGTDFAYFDPPFNSSNDPSEDLPDSALGVDGLVTYRDSFFWGPRQAASLPTDLTTISATQLFQARMRHWLHDPDTYAIGQALGLELEPSPDGGQTMGQSIWYSYYGPSVTARGTNSLPALVSMMLPDVTPNYTWYRRDIAGHATNVVQTYSTTFGESPSSRTNRYVYSNDGTDLLQVIGPAGEVMAGYGYDANHHLLRFTNAAGDSASYSYDTYGRLTTITNAAGLVTVRSYFTSGQYTNWVQQTVDLQINRTNSFTYTNDLVWTHTDERGLTTTFTYDALGRLTSDSDSRGTVYYYYNNLDLSQKSDRMGFGTWFGHDALRRLTAVTNALGYYTLYNYCCCGALDSIQDALGNLTSFYYDSAGRLTNTTYADSYVASRQLDSLGRIFNEIDSAGISKTNWFNNQGLLYAVSNAAGNVTTTTFDLEDRATNNVDGNGVTTVMTFDSPGRLLSRSYPDGGIEYFGYSAAGLIAYTNQLGFVTCYVYDAARRKTAETNANLEVIQYSYNAAGDLLTLTDGKAQITTWGTDQFGRATNKLDQTSAEILRYTYDPDNRLTNRWSAAKGNTAYSFDNVGNLTLINYPASSDVTFTYDPLNRVTNMVDGVGTTVYSYTSTGQLLSEDGPFASDTVTNGYSNRLRTGLGLQQPTGEWTNGFTFDGSGRFAMVTSPAGTFTYYPVSGAQNLIAGISLPNLSFITNFFDGDARLTATYLENSTYSILDAAIYGYNQGNQRTAFTNAAGTYVLYSYDGMGQLKVATSSASGESRGYAYDAAWNLNWLTNGSTYHFLVDTKNELTNAFSSTYGFDSNGNVTSGTNGHTTYVYDDENRLIQWFWYAAGSGICSNGALRTDFAYDGLGRLRKRTEYSVAMAIIPPPPSGGGGGGGGGCSWYTNGETRYIYDGNRVIQERDGSNNPQVAYTRGPDLSGTLEGAGGIGGFLARSDSYSSGNFTRHNFYHVDGNGNITYLETSGQGLAASYRYDPYGNVTSSSGTLASANVYRFSSKEYMTNSGSYYYLYRFYDPNLQRWLNRDPIEELGGVNLHGFAGNNPINRRDALGLLSPACEAARQALADAQRNAQVAPGPLTKAALSAAVVAEAAACGSKPEDDGYLDVPLPPPTPLPNCKPIFEPTRPLPEPPPYQNNQGNFCQRHPVICGGGMVVATGVIVGGVLILSGGTATPVLIGAAAAL